MKRNEVFYRRLYRVYYVPFHGFICMKRGSWFHCLAVIKLSLSEDLRYFCLQSLGHTEIDKIIIPNTYFKM